MAMEQPEPTEGLKIIHVALFRMATRSFTEAYRTLGYSVHHGLDDVPGNPWVLIEQAAESTWPNVPGAPSSPRPRRTREDWDQIWGSKYDIATDLASPFTDQLIAAYPDAKVVVVQRDFETWWPSYKSELLDSLYKPLPRVLVFIAGLMGMRAGCAMSKIHHGLFGAASVAEIEAHARETYDAYFRRIRAMVPPERRLEYRLGDGWEPLCAYLGKEVPDMPFPRLNDRKSHGEDSAKRLRHGVLRMIKKAAPALLVVGAVLIALRRM